MAPARAGDHDPVQRVLDSLLAAYELAIFVAFLLISIGIAVAGVALGKVELVIVGALLAVGSAFLVRHAWPSARTARR